MRKPLPDGFGTRGAVPITSVIEITVPQPKRGWSNTDKTVRYGLILKIALALWAMTIATAMLWS